VTPAIDLLAGRLGDRGVRDAPLGERTTYRVGGPAALLVEVGDDRSLRALAAATRGLEVPVLVLGRGSNLLVADAGFPGVVVHLTGAFEALTISGIRVEAGGAVSLPVLARRTVAEGLRGLEWAVGVPGSVGGAVRMNAGGHGSDVAACLEQAVVVDLRSGACEPWAPSSLDLRYRGSALRDWQIVVGATFRTEPGDAEAGAALVEEIVRWRRANQPGGQNSGSVFTNPPGDAAGRLVEAAGAKGLRIGTAEVSIKHANFIQADPGGSAADVASVIAEARRMVAEVHGVDLRPEVRLVGFGADVVAATGARS